MEPSDWNIYFFARLIYCLCVWIRNWMMEFFRKIISYYHVWSSRSGTFWTKFLIKEASSIWKLTPFFRLKNFSVKRTNPLILSWLYACTPVYVSARLAHFFMVSMLLTFVRCSPRDHQADATQPPKKICVYQVMLSSTDERNEKYSNILKFPSTF